MGGAVDHEILMCIERILYVTQVKNKKYAQERKQETEKTWDSLDTSKMKRQKYAQWN